MTITETETETVSTQTVDVFIAGGGLAGLTLALQIKKARPETSVVVAEKGKHPAPNATFKVGESSLDGAGHYLGTILGLEEYLKKEHLLKPGFRFFAPAGDNQDITKRFELATLRNWDPAESAPSYQLDRGKLETKLGEEVCRHGVTFLDDCKIIDLSLAESGPHAVTFVQHETETHLKARWVIDASGVASILRRQLDLNQEIDHDINAVWFRVNKIISVQDWADDPLWQARFASVVRRLTTTHLTGKGYWVWLIPLAGDLTSVGIVADNALYPFNQINRREQAMAWLQQHEPQCAAAVANSEILDFAVLKHYAHGCKQMFSANRWAITGVAGAFSDPLYSPGSELIAIGNTLITDLVCRDLAGEAIAPRVDFFNNFYLNFAFDAVLTDVKGFYNMLDSSLIVAIKKIWQFTWYFSVMTPLVFRQKLADIDYLTLIEAELAHFQRLHRRVQALCQQLYAQGPHQPTVDHLIYVFQLKTLQQIILKKPSDDSDQAWRDLLRYNLTVMESFVTSLCQQLHPPPAAPSDVPANVQAAAVAEFNDFWRAWQPTTV